MGAAACSASSGSAAVTTSDGGDLCLWTVECWVIARGCSFVCNMRAKTVTRNVADCQIKSAIASARVFVGMSRCFCSVRAPRTSSAAVQVGVVRRSDATRVALRVVRSLLRRSCVSVMGLYLALDDFSWFR
jgi:hypothetical protein